MISIPTIPDLHVEAIPVYKQSNEQLNQLPADDSSPQHTLINDDSSQGSTESPESSSTYQVADVLTKPLSKLNFIKHRESLSIRESTQRAISSKKNEAPANTHDYAKEKEPATHSRADPSIKDHESSDLQQARSQKATVNSDLLKFADNGRDQQPPQRSKSFTGEEVQSEFIQKFQRNRKGSRNFLYGGRHFLVFQTLTVS